MKDGTIVFFSSSPTLKHFFKWLLGEFIQLFVPGEDEHCGIISRGMYYEALVKKGVVSLRFKKKVSSIPYSVKITYFEPRRSRITKKRSLSLNEDIKKQVGKKYSIKQAIYSAIDTTNLLSKIFKPKSEENKQEKAFCSKLVFIGYSRLGIFDNQIMPESINPGELVKLIEQSDFFKERKVYER